MRNNGPAGRRWMKLAVAGLVVAVAALFFQFRALGKDKTPGQDYRKAAVERRDLEITRVSTGEVRPQNRVEVKPPIAGRIEEVLVREGDTVTQGQVLAWMSSSERAALLDAARSQGEDAVSRWESVYKPAPLVSPLNGTVIVRAVEPGQSVTTTDPVVVVADRLMVLAQVDETDIGSIAVGQKAEITLDAYPQELIPGHVEHVAYEAKTVNNVTIYEVDVLPENVHDAMRSGMTATLTLVVESRPNVLVVPAEAVRAEGGGVSVLIPGAQPWGRPAPKAVTTGLTDGKWTEVTSGLVEGDTVLIQPFKLPDAREAGRNPFSPFGSGRSNGGRRR